ncbi:oxidized low-density lipoprotein receptor 1-like isoform X1 [Mobula birostris]|uniref:oxidized low-density lipoprotein receptor 1-like isoform X1 n=2 Tax=Mobula birostris TaxID=1983395 RepID=UPI003B28AFC5
MLFQRDEMASTTGHSSEVFGNRYRGDVRDDMVSERPTGRDRSDSSIWLICVLTATLIITGICWRIHVSQIRQSKFTVDRNYDELNSTLQSKINEMEAKYKAVNETKAQICELLTSRRGQPCSDEWIPNKDRCYYVSTSERSFHEAMQECSNLDSRLLEIDSRDEASFVFHKLVHPYRAYWIGKCEEGNVDWRLLYKVHSATHACSQCKTNGRNNRCDLDRRFICEKSAPLFPDIPEKIQGLCRQPLETS